MRRTSFNLRGKNVAMMSIIKVVIVIMMIMRRCATVELDNNLLTRATRTKINITNVHRSGSIEVVRDRRRIEQLCPE